MANASSTAEQAAAYVESLAREKEGYEARIAASKAGRAERLTEAQLKDRIGQVDAEIKRAKKLAGKAEPEPKEEPAA